MKTKKTTSTAILLTLLLCTVNVSATWWNTNYDYKKPIEIDSTASLTNYQVAINVSYDSDMQSDFDDLRFTNEEENVLLDYWIESKSDDEWAYVWVEIDSIDSENGTQAYMYYGNSGASSKSNITGTMEAGDSFDRVDNDTVGNGWSENSGDIKIYSNSLRIIGDGLSSDYVSNSIGEGDNPTVWEGKIRTNAQANSGKIFKTPSESYALSLNGDGYVYYIDGSAYTWVKSSKTFSPSTWYKWKILRNNSGYSNNIKYYFDGTLLANEDIYSGEYNINDVQISVYSSTQTLDIEYISRRKYASSEPTYSIGSEETSNQAPNNPNPSITPATIYTNTNANCTATYIDLDGDTGNLTFRWYVDTTSVKNETFSALSNDTSKWSILDSGNYTKNQIINCTVIATDNNSQSTTSSVTKTVQNSAPTTPASLTPTSGTYTTSVTINCSGSTDNDPSDIVLYDIETNRTGSWTTLENDGDGYYVWTTSSYTQNNVDLRCRATDSTDNSSYYNPSGTINIDNTAPSINLNTTASDYNTVLDRVWAYIVFYSDSTLNACMLDWNKTNSSIDKSGTTCYKNKTSLAVGNYTFRGWVNDSLGNWGSSSEYWVYINATTTTTTTSTTTTTLSSGGGGGGGGITSVAQVTTEPTCDDGIQNQEEEGVDCGGPCSPCKVSTTTTIKSTASTTTLKTTTTTVKKATPTTTTTTEATATTTTIGKTPTTMSTGGGVALATTGIVILAFVLFAGVVVYLIRMK